MNTSEHQSRSRALNEKQAAQYCGISISKLRNGRTKPSKPSADVSQHRNIGKRVVYLRDDLDAWLNEHRRTTLKVGAA